MIMHDVVIVGAGPAGLSAAAALRKKGVRDIVILERESEAGGVPRHCAHPGFGLREFRWLLTGPEYARRLAAAAGDSVRLSATVTALQPGGVLDLVTPQGRTQIAGRCVLLALGARETPRGARLVGGTRPWGVTSTGALQQMIYLAGLHPFARPVIIGSELVSFSALLTLRHAGIRAAAMIEENGRITAQRPGDLVAKWIFGVPVLTGHRLVAIRGRAQVESVEVDGPHGRRMIACDGVIFTGRFTPEASLLAGSHLNIDDGTGGPAIDQNWSCSDPAYFAAGNLLRPIETAGVAAAEGRAAADAIVDTLSGRTPAPSRWADVRYEKPLRYIYPQRIASPGRALTRLQLVARVDRETRGRLVLAIDGREVWSRTVHALPERRLRLPAGLVPTDKLERIEVRLESA